MITGPQCHPDGVCGYGSTDSGILFIGIAPGADEWRSTHKPFTGPSGKLLDAVLSAHGIQRDTTYCTNLICYWNDAPDKDDILACAPRLQQEISTINPCLIVLLGKIACESILQIPFSKARGAIIRHTDGRTYLATYHPAACLHTGKSAAEKEVQIEAAYSLVRDLGKLANPIKEWPSPTYTVVDTQEQAQHVLDTLSSAKLPIAIDIETDYDKEYEKSHPFDHDITCIGVGNSPEHAYVLTRKAVSNLQWPNAQWVFHNGVFDTQEIARILGVWLPIREDTMLQSYSLDERSVRGLHKLKHLAREYCGSDFYEEDNHKLDGSVEQDSKLYEYNAKDVVYTQRLHTHLTAWLQQPTERDTSERVYRELLLPAAGMLARSQYRGIYVNPDNVNQITMTFGKEFFTVKKELDTFAEQVLGTSEFNINSPVQVKKMLFYQGYYLDDTRKATLQQLIEDEPDIPFVGKLLRYRTLHKMIRNYLFGVQEQIKYDGRVHPHAFLIGTSTGRLSYKDPAMQTLPKPKTVKDLGRIRSIFSATTSDYILLEADYAQIEAWLGAYFSEDDNLLHDLQSSDWHSQVATAMFNVTPASTDAQTWAFYRDAAKHINYGSMYGEEAHGLTRRPPIGIGCDLPTAQRYLAAWRQHYPQFVLYQRRLRHEAQNVGYIATPFGRKRRFPLIVNDHQLRQAMNTQLQSTASDYTLSSAIRLEEPLHDLDTHLLFLEHDAIYYEVRREHLQEVVELIKYTMEQPPLPGLPSIRTVVEIGPNLAELK